MTILILGLLLIFLGLIFIRYIPVAGVKCRELCNLNETFKIVDVRDYNESYQDQILNGINIPIAYIKRHYHEINHSKIFVVASNHLEKNISIRLLRKKGFVVVGYSLTVCDCSK
ncbi:hypothetical protein [Bacillus dakarensis]|uniref:hypothetical protein n=1 Tax=Robertmurraya dakarensis TaxID=1926278 RepID=UPI0009810108|nr:hypothetical protein [Bacillus dakarensis]